MLLSDIIHVTIRLGEHHMSLWNDNSHWLFNIVIFVVPGIKGYLPKTRPPKKAHYFSHMFMSLTEA
jgi:hypothetical protein